MFEREFLFIVPLFDTQIEMYARNVTHYTKTQLAFRAQTHRYIAPVAVTVISGATVRITFGQNTHTHTHTQNRTTQTQILFWVVERQKWGKFLQYLSTNTAKEVIHKDSSSNSPASSPLGPHGERGRFFPADEFGKKDNSGSDGDLRRDSASRNHTDDGIELKI